MTIFVDDKEIKAEKGQTVIEAMNEAGIDLPHFCWHPALSVAGNCRMCLVEIGNEQTDEDGNKSVRWIPKLQIGCATPVTEGMHVRASSERVLKARRGVMEFILINHPLDCPICDEAGECKLQDYAVKHSIGESRFTEEKAHKPKRVEWSDKIIYDGERCIMCSRCIRFAKEVAGQDVLTFKNRGDKVYIEVEDGKTFDNPYSMNVIDICPVGALTSADFRFKSRVWDMSFGDTISPLDSTGSKIRAGTRQNKILRVTPPEGFDSNGPWITDETRLGLDKYNKNRITAPEIEKNGSRTEVEFPEALAEAVKALKKVKPDEILFVCSPTASNESNKAVIDFARNVIKTENITYFEHIDEKAEEDGRLQVKDKSPNLAGLKNLLPKPKKIESMSNKIKLVYVLEEEFEYAADFTKELDKVETLIYQGIFKDEVYKKANVVLAASSILESNGTLTNKDGVTQTFKPLLRTKEQLPLAVEEGRLDKFGQDNDKWNKYDIPNTLQSTTIVKGLKNIWTK